MFWFMRGTPRRRTIVPRSIGWIRRFPAELRWASPGLCSQVLSLVTHPRVMATPLTITEAIDTVEHWLGARSAQVLQPGTGHTSLLREMLTAVGSGGNLTNDAHLAALAGEYKATVVSFDADFDRFPGVRWEQPR